MAHEHTMIWHKRLQLRGGAQRPSPFAWRAMVGRPSRGDRRTTDPSGLCVARRIGRRQGVVGETCDHASKRASSSAPKWCMLFSSWSIPCHVYHDVRMFIFACSDMFAHVRVRASWGEFAICLVLSSRHLLRLCSVVLRSCLHGMCMRVVRRNILAQIAAGSLSRFAFVRLCVVWGSSRCECK